MAEIGNALQTVMSTIWLQLMGNRLLPAAGFEVSNVYIVTWLLLIFAEFFRVWIFAEIEEHLDDD